MTREEYETLSKETHNYKVTVAIQRLEYGYWDDEEEWTETETTDLEEASDVFDDLQDPQQSYLFDFRRCERRPRTKRYSIILWVDGKTYEEGII